MHDAGDSYRVAFSQKARHREAHDHVLARNRFLHGRSHTSVGSYATRGRAPRCQVLPRHETDSRFTVAAADNYGFTTRRVFEVLSDPRLHDRTFTLEIS